MPHADGRYSPSEQFAVLSVTMGLSLAG